MTSKNDILEEIEDCLRSIEEADIKEHFEDDLAFYVATEVVEHNDTSFIKHLPMHIANKVYEIASTYNAKGEYKVYSNLGCKDHSEMAKQLSIILKNKKND